MDPSQTRQLRFGRYMKRRTLGSTVYEDHGGVLIQTLQDQGDAVDQTFLLHLFIQVARNGVGLGWVGFCAVGGMRCGEVGWGEMG